ncbi:3'-5' exonuclease [Aureimonas sp. N4]|uniref:3'-5' exonuclease n=1 Tax=Aureimonas sp. N4 TaxID=1638165 RepID=UPI0009EA8BC2|nr:3'-5' exonuclease [Aureimonas sp. N4]
MTILAIDFETATSEAASACAVGLAFVEGGRVTKQAYSLIRPRDLRFDPGNIRVHGIRPHDVLDAPSFADIFASFAAEMDGALVVAHNASFDLKVLRESLALYGLAQPRFSALCTVALSRRLWPDSPNHKLSTMAARFGLGFRHHHAGDDAYACAHIALEGVVASGALDISDMADRLSLRRAVASQPARRQGGVAERALKAQVRPAGAGQGSFRYTVRGSRGTPYDVLLAPFGRAGAWRLACSCPGARFRDECRHVRALHEGDFTDLLPVEAQAMARLERFVTEKAGLGEPV